MNLEIFIDDLIGQLSAGCINIFTAASPDVDNQVFPVEKFFKRHRTLFAGVLIWHILYRIILDQVDLDREIFTEFRQGPGISHGIIKTPEHNVFKGNARVCLLVKELHRLDQVFQGIPQIVRYDLVPLFVNGRMQRKGEIKPDLVLTQLPYHRGNANG